MLAPPAHLAPGGSNWNPAKQSFLTLLRSLNLCRPIRYTCPHSQAGIPPQAVLDDQRAFKHFEELASELQDLIAEQAVRAVPGRIVGLDHPRYLYSRLCDHQLQSLSQDLLDPGNTRAWRRGRAAGYRLGLLIGFQFGQQQYRVHFNPAKDIMYLKSQTPTYDALQLPPFLKICHKTETLLLSLSGPESDRQAMYMIADPRLFPRAKTVWVTVAAPLVFYEAASPELGDALFGNEMYRAIRSSHIEDMQEVGRIIDQYPLFKSFMDTVVTTLLGLAHNHIRIMSDVQSAWTARRAMLRPYVGPYGNPPEALVMDEAKSADMPDFRPAVFLVRIEH